MLRHQFVISRFSPSLQHPQSTQYHSIHVYGDRRIFRACRKAPAAWSISILLFYYFPNIVIFFFALLLWPPRRIDHLLMWRTYSADGSDIKMAKKLFLLSFNLGNWETKKCFTGHRNISVWRSQLFRLSSPRA